MALPVNEPVNEVVVGCYTTSLGATPVAGWAASPVKGRLVRTYAVVSTGTSTGSGTIAVKINGAGSDIGALAVPIGAAGTTTTDAPAGTRDVNEGDAISFTPAGAGGAGVTGQMYAVIRK